jgi:hypothetical protein
MFRNGRFPALNAKFRWPDWADTSRHLGSGQSVRGETFMTATWRANGLIEVRVSSVRGIDKRDK